MDFGLIYVVVGGLIIMFWFPYMGVFRSNSKEESMGWYVRMLAFIVLYFIGAFVMDQIIG